MCYRFCMGGSATRSPEPLRQEEPQPSPESPLERIRQVIASIDDWRKQFFCPHISTSENSASTRENSASTRAYKPVNDFEADVRHQFATKVIPYIRARYAGHDDPWLAAFNEYSRDSCAGGFFRKVLYCEELNKLFFESHYRKPPGAYPSPGIALTRRISGEEAITLEEFRALALLQPRGVFHLSTDRTAPRQPGANRDNVPSDNRSASPKR